MILLTLSRGKGEETVRLQLPASPAEIGETFAFLDRISLDTTATAILDVSSNVPVLYRCLYDVDVEDSEQFQKLQKLAERTEALSPAKAAIFSGALDAECVWNLEGALTVADRLDEYMLVNNVSSDSELGIYLVNKGITPFPDRFKPYINYARVGAEYREKHGGEYSSGNYVQKKTPELLENERLDGVFRIWMENPCPVRVQSETAQITLPATFEQLESARQLLGVDSLNMAKLTRVEALRPYLGEYLPLQGMDLRLEQLDELAENIRIMDQEDGALLKYLSVLEVEQPATLQEALRFSIELDDYERVPDDPEEYGKQVLERIGADEELISKILTTYLDQPATAKQEQRTLAVQISDDMFQRLKSYLDAHAPLTQKALVQSLLNQALDQWEHGEEPLQSAVLQDNKKERTLAIAMPESLFHRVEQYVEAHNGVSKRVFVVGLVAQELQSWLMEQSPDEVQDQEFGPDQDEQGFGMSMTM